MLVFVRMEYNEKSVFQVFSLFLALVVVKPLYQVSKIIFCIIKCVIVFSRKY